MLAHDDRWCRWYLVACLAVAMAGASPADAQDRLFVDTAVLGREYIEVGALGHFGQPLGRITGPIPLPPRAAPFLGQGQTLVDAATHAVVWTAPAGQSIIGVPIVTPDHTRAFVDTSEDGNPFGAAWTYAVDIASGTTVAWTSALASPRWDPVGRRLIANTFDSPGFAAYDANLVPLGTFKPATSHCAPSVSISPHTARAYVIYVGEGSGGRYGPSDTRLMAIDLTSQGLVADVSLVETLGVSNRAECPPGLVLWTAPAVPEGVRAEVSGRDVALSWFATDLADRYLLEFGVAPGRTDLRYFVGPTTGVRFARVPSGVYYVRVRAGNLMGGGRASAEIRVSVP